MRKLIYSTLVISILSIGLNSCASSKGGGWYKNRNNTYVPEKPQNPVKLVDSSEEFMSEAEMILAREK